MHARVWQLQIKPGKEEEFVTATEAVIRLVRQQDGYYGVIALGSDGPNPGGVRLVALWDSPDSAHESEKNLFLMQAMSRYMSCCEGVPKIVEQEVLASDFAAD